MEKLFQTPATIQGISTLRDKTLKITAYISKELPGEEKAKLFDLEQKEGWLLFKENAIQSGEIPEEKAEIGINKKSYTQRLYNVLFVYHSKKYPTDKNFSSWRDNEMEKLIDFYKSKID